jgi:CheY-like chemotaxis protein
MAQKPAKRILVVEDSSNWQELICNLLNEVANEQTWEIQIIVVSSLEEALEQIAAGPFEFVTLDNRLVDSENAKRLLETISKLGWKTPVVVVSGVVQPNEVRNFFKVYGVVEFFWKDTFDHVEFKRVVAERMPVTGTLTWLHFSDLHIGCKEPNKDWASLSKALLEDVQEHQKPSDQQALRCARVTLQPDLIFITGDVAYHGSEEEYKQAEEFLSSIWTTTGLGNDRTFVVPGNHDVDRRVVENDPMYVSAYKELADPALGAQAWLTALSKWWSYQPLRNLIRDKLQYYSKFIAKCSAHTTIDGYYAQTVRVSGADIDILGLNSASMSWRDGEDRERGLWVGKPQLDEIEKSLPQNIHLRIALVHHPREALHDRDTSWGRLQQTCSILFHGHLHQLRAMYIGEPEREHISLPGGSVHEGGVFSSQHYSYGRFNLGTGELDLYLRMTTPHAYPRYIRDIQTYPDAAADGHVRLRLRNKTSS